MAQDPPVTPQQSNAPKWLLEFDHFYGGWAFTRAADFQASLDEWRDLDPDTRRFMEFHVATLSLRAQAQVTKRLALIQEGIGALLRVGNNQTGGLELIVKMMEDELGIGAPAPDPAAPPPQEPRSTEPTHPAPRGIAPVPQPTSSEPADAPRPVQAVQRKPPGPKPGGTRKKKEEAPKGGDNGVAARTGEA